MQTVINLDNAATTRMRKETLDAIMPYLTDDYGNASALYSLGRISRDIIDKTREKIAARLNCYSSDIYFTSGSTESNNWVMNFIAETFDNYIPNIITTNIEHPSVLNTLNKLVENNLVTVSIAEVNSDGLVNPKDIEALITPDTTLVSVQYANNEIGTIQPIKEIGEICKKYTILFHVDATQAFGHIDIDVDDLGIDLLSASGHKFGAMKGIGFLYANENVMITPFMCGGHQESGIRAGTENVAGIASMYYALDHQYKDLSEIRQYILDNLDATLNGHPTQRLSSNLSLTFEGVQAEALMMMLDEQGILVSTGSACASDDDTPSYVLKAIGLTDEQANSTIRITLNDLITKEDIDYVINCINDDVKILRG